MGTLKDTGKRLATLEATIERGVKEVGQALSEIRAEKLFPDKTFEAYCKRRWGFGRNYANKMIAANETAKHLGTIVPISEVPTRETHLREIGKAKPENQAQVLKQGQQIAKANDRKPTANDFEQARGQVETGTIVPKTPSTEPTPQWEWPVDGTGPVIVQFAKLVEDAKRLLPQVDSDTAANLRNVLDKHHPIKKPAKTPTKRFKPPTVKEVAEYGREYSRKRQCEGKSYRDLDANQFVDYYASNGWKVGRNPMKDWKATVRRWILPSQSEGVCQGQGMEFM